MRQPQSPNAASPMAGANAEDQQQRQEQAERRRGLDPGGVIAALVGRGVFGDVDRRAAIFAAEREALNQAQRDQHDRRHDAPRAHKPGSRPMKNVPTPISDHRDQEGVFAPDHVAEPAEDQRAERPNRKAGGEGRAARR